MKYLVSYSTGTFGLKEALEPEDTGNPYAEVSDDFDLSSKKVYSVFSDGTYEVKDKVKIDTISETTINEQGSVIDFKSMVQNIVNTI